MIRLKQLWKSEKKLTDYIKELNPKRILLPFGHGLGDTILFMNPFDKLASLYPDIEFTLAMQKYLGFEELERDITGANKKVIFSSDLSYKEEVSEYDMIADIDFPMSEGQIEFTKGEFCCIHELGIEPVGGHKTLAKAPNRLVAVHFQITCLPDAANPDRDTAEKIWNEILEVGYIPIETHFKHAFHNPVNEKFDFIDCHVRRVKAQVSSLVGLLQNCGACIMVVSGNFHTALATLPPERVFFLEKHFKLECFTHLPVARASIMPGEYKEGVIKEWLQNMPI
jgi:hypothetical protein